MTPVRKEGLYFVFSLWVPRDGKDFNLGGERDMGCQSGFTRQASVVQMIAEF